jgi:DNA topoisomerase-1
VNGQKISDREVIARIKSLVIPPAWKDVWICEHPRGHLQVTARDARGRKQYRYHPEYREVRDEAKFERILAFSTVLPRIRERVARDIALEGHPRAKVMATVVWLLERTLIRIGTDEYARTNKSYGLTTLQRRHVEVDGSELRFEFRGKSGIEHSVEVTDKRIARIVQRCQELPGQELFKFLDDDGKRQTVDAGDVNQYLKDITGDDITAKDFRTWAGTMLAARQLRNVQPARSERERKQNVVKAIDDAAKQLGNTRAVCRKYYIHPEVLAAYMEDRMLPPTPPHQFRQRRRSRATLRREEAEVLAFIQERIEKRPSKRLR